MRVSLVIAVAENGVIGRKGALPWRLASDMRHFKAVTMGKPVIMGRKTFASIGGPLPGRTTIVVTRNPDLAAEGVRVAQSFEEALALGHSIAHETGAGEIMVVGGAEIYRAAMAHAERLYLTRVHLAPEGDAFFPTPDAADWQVVSSAHHAREPKDDAAWTLLVLDRVRDLEDDAGAR